MYYRKFIYRRLDFLVDKAEKMLAEGKELIQDFKETYDLSQKLRAESKNIRENHEKMNLTWSDAVKKFCTIDREAEILLKNAVRPYLGPQFVNVHVLVGYCPQTIPYYQKMIKELRKTFPRAKTEDISLGKVTKSSCVQGFTLITYSTETSFIETKDEYSKYKVDAPNGKSYYVSENCEYYW